MSNKEYYIKSIEHQNDLFKKQIEEKDLIIDGLLEELKAANDIIRSFHSVIERSGTDTNWEALMGRVKEILSRQHKIMYPEQYAQ